MNKNIRNQARQLLDIQPLADMYYKLMGPGEPYHVDDFLALVNLIVRFVENPDIKELEQRYDELISQIPVNSDEEADRFVWEMIQVTNDVFDRALQLHEQNNFKLSWHLGKGAVAVNGN